MPARLITYAIVQDTRDANLIYLGTNLGVYRSIDRGTSWTPVWAPSTPGKKKVVPKKGAKPQAGATASKRRVPVGQANETVLHAQEALAAHLK